MLKSIEYPYAHLHAQLDQGVLILSIDRAEAKNALNNEERLQATFLDIMSQNSFILPEEKEMLHRWNEDQKSEL